MKRSDVDTMYEVMKGQRPDDNERTAFDVIL